MKKYFIIPFLLILCVLSWFFTIKDFKSGNAAFENYMASAENYYEKKIYSDAEENYKKALQKQPKNENALLGLAYTFFAEEKYKEAADVCEKILATEPNKAEVAILAAKSLSSGGEYSKSLNILSKMEQSEEIENMIIDIKSKYSLKYIVIENPQNFDIYSPPMHQFCSVFSKNRMSCYNSKGIWVAHGEISYLGGVCEGGELFPAVSDGKWCFVTSSGERKLVPDADYNYLGPIRDGLAVVKQDDKYFYVDSSFKTVSPKYDNAYNFALEKAVVMDGSNVKIVNTSFETIAKTPFSGVVSDAYGYTDHFGTSVFTKGKTFYLCDSSGAKISDFSAEYIGLPMESGALVEFKHKNLYGFVNSGTGEIAIKPKYEEAGAFCRGLAPIKIDGKWGFIDEAGTEIVKPSFLFASPLSNDGTAWVQNEAGFALLSFYFLSEED